MPDRNSNRQSAVPVDGLLLLNKPAGITSNRALQTVKRLLRARKAGHTGALDPAARGMLPLCFGEATKVSAYLLDADKSYRVVARLGEQTDTGDADGKVIRSATVPALHAADWEAILDRFRGEIDQVPPMYSALKKDGKRLYELARQGETVERLPRRVTIKELVQVEAHGQRLVMRVRCSKGTYIRSLVEDIGRAAGTLAYTASLFRERVGGFRPEDMLDLSEAVRLAEDGPEALQAALLPIDSALEHWPQVSVSSADAARFVRGQSVPAVAGEAGRVRVYAEPRRFLGIAERGADGTLAPRRVFHLPG